MTVSQRKFAELAAPIFGTSVGVARRKLQAWDKLGILSPIEKQGERKASRYSSEQLEDLKRILQEQAQAKYEGAISLFNTHDITPATNAETIEGSEENQADRADDETDDEIQDPPASEVTAALDKTVANCEELDSIEGGANHTPIEALPLEKKNDSEATPPITVPAVQSPPFIEDMAGTLEGKSLQELADEGRLCFERGDDHIKQGLMYYIEGGRRLIEAKRRLPHGQWQPWLKEHFSFSQDTATNRMKLAERFAESKSETFRNLKPATAIKLLALPEGTEEEFIKAQADAGKPIENQSAREVQSAVKEFKQAKEIGGEYINVTGSEKNNPVVNELNNKDNTPANNDSGENDFSSFEETAPANNTDEESISKNTPSASSSYDEKPVDVKFKLDAIKNFRIWQGLIENFGEAVEENQLNTLINLFGEYWLELGKPFTYEKNLIHIAERILTCAKEICKKTADLAAMVKIEVEKLKGSNPE